MRKAHALVSPAFLVLQRLQLFFYIEKLTFLPTKDARRSQHSKDGADRFDNYLGSYLYSESALASRVRGADSRVIKLQACVSAHLVEAWY